MDEDVNLEAEEDVENMMIDSKINPDLSDEMQDMLYDQPSTPRRSFLLTFGWVDLNRVWGSCGRQWRTARRTSRPVSGDATRGRRNHGPT